MATRSTLLLVLLLCLGGRGPGVGQLTATVVGSGSPAYDENRASASVLISAGETRILVDMGSGAQANLREVGVDPSTVSALLITHHHLDHTGEFILFLSQSLLGRRDLQVAGPPGTRELVDFNLDFYAEDLRYRLGRTGRNLEARASALSVVEVQGGEVFDIGGVRVSTLEVPHTIQAVAYRFDCGGESIVVTGDLSYSASVATFARDADFLIIDAGGMIMKGGTQAQALPGMAGQPVNRPRPARRIDASGRPASRPGDSEQSSARAAGPRERAHLSLAESSSLAGQAHVGTLVYTHITPGEVDVEESLKTIRQSYDGKVVFAEDLMVLGQAQPAADVPPTAPGAKGVARGYPIVDTGQGRFFDNDGEIPAPDRGDPFYGQDAQYAGRRPAYRDNGDGTVTDQATDLMWQKGFEVLTYDEALKYAARADIGGYDDWRLPTIKELYSLIRFDGTDPSGRDMTRVPTGARPFIDTAYFDFEYGANGERIIDSQYLSATVYGGRTMRGDRTVFGVNFADGRIKGYPLVDPRSGAGKPFSVRLVRGSPVYGQNLFLENGDGTVSDSATGLMWSEEDSGRAMTWEEALRWAQEMNDEAYLGHNDWRVPNAKELQSILDYSRSPQATHSPSIDPVFSVSTMKDERGQSAYPCYLSSTTHLQADGQASSAVYLCFGEALGYMRFPGSGEVVLMDVHGAGAQRADPKAGRASDFPQGHGPQGDVVRVTHYVRLVRDLEQAGGSITPP